MNQPLENHARRAGRVGIDVERSPDASCVVQVKGELLSASTPKLRRIIADELNRSPTALVLDLAGVTRIDDAGVDALVSAATQAGESDIALCLIAVRGSVVAGALADAELTELFEILPMVNDT